jgi:hypothetical protein
MIGADRSDAGSRPFRGGHGTQHGQRGEQMIDSAPSVRTEANTGRLELARAWKFWCARRWHRRRHATAVAELPKHH